MPTSGVARLLFTSWFVHCKCLCAPPATGLLTSCWPKVHLNELCQKRSWGAPQYVVAQQRRPLHGLEFRATVRLCTGQPVSESLAPLTPQQQHQGDWQRTVKHAEASAALSCLAALGVPAPPPDVGLSAPRSLAPLYVQQSAKQHLLRACQANGWPPPEFSTVPQGPHGQEGFESTLTMTGGELAGASFVAHGQRRVAAECTAAAAAFKVLRARIVPPAGKEGTALEALRAAVARDGLKLIVAGSNVAIGRKERVLALRDAPTVRLGVSPWSGWAVEAHGRGLRRKACLDDAALRVHAHIDTAAFEQWRPRRGALPSYVRSQSLLATSDSAECEEWLAAHVPR